MMKLAAALALVAANSQGIARMSWITGNGDTVDSFEDYKTRSELNNITVDDAIAEDWVVEPIRAFSITETLLASQWNASLSPDAAPSNRAPASPRYQRFLAGLKGAVRG